MGIICVLLKKVHKVGICGLTFHTIFAILNKLHRGDWETQKCLSKKKKS
jgi:hypothetical protein